ATFGAKGENYRTSVRWHDFSQNLFLLSLGQDYAYVRRQGQRLVKLYRIRNFWREYAARLFRSRVSESSPSFNSFCSARGEMRIGSSCDQRNNRRHCEFGAFLDCPFHSIELED